MRAKALFMALSKKQKDGEIVFVNSFDIEKPSTASAKKALVALSKNGFGKLDGKKNNAALVAFSDAKEASVKLRNIGNIRYSAVRDRIPVAILRHSSLPHPRKPRSRRRDPRNPRTKQE